ncbi:hypothetical protein [Brevibacillus reuszeri]|uniref:hypothetical protein n=1 Tax=Brevibacillus reuszeri TaxID=54915 RepID=UPI003D2360A6
MPNIILDNKIIFVVLFILLSTILYVFIYTIKRNDRLKVEKRELLENKRREERVTTNANVTTDNDSNKNDATKIEIHDEEDAALLNEVMKEAVESDDTDYTTMTEQELRECYRKLRISLGTIDYLIKVKKLDAEIGLKHRDRMRIVLAVLHERIEIDKKEKI